MNLRFPTTRETLGIALIASATDWLVTLEMFLLSANNMNTELNPTFQFFRPTLGIWAVAISGPLEMLVIPSSALAFILLGQFFERFLKFKALGDCYHVMAVLLAFGPFLGALSWLF
jgi:hypothetical protein